MSDSLPAQAVILTALDVEYAAVRSHLDRLLRVSHKGTQYEVGRLGTDGLGVAIVEIGPGNVGAAFEAERAISRFQPNLLLFVGVAGSLKDAQIGDVVAGTKVYGYDTGKDDEVLLSRPDIAMSSYPLEQLARVVRQEAHWLSRRPVTRFDPRDSFDAFVGPIAAGEKVVASTSSATYTLIRERLNDALAVEMEAIGMLRAARANDNLDAMVIRGISDLVDGKAGSDASGSQVVASASAAAFAVELIQKWALTRETHPAAAYSAIGTTGGVFPRALASNYWLELERVGTSLYPRGPQHDDLWSRSGGDVGSLDFTGSGRAMWHRAIQKLQNGGGGTTASRLITVMRSEYPNHLDVKALSDSFMGR